MEIDPSITTDDELASRIRAARSRLGWSLSETAGRTGLSRAYINALERGRGKRPGADVIRRLEDVFGSLHASTAASVDDAPSGLIALARERQIPAGEVRMLAGLRIRGQQPRTMERWRFIYDALVASEHIDAETRSMGSADEYGAGEESI